MYLPPEMLLDLEPTKAVDIWCFGCLLFEYLFGTPLFVDYFYVNADEGRFQGLKDRHLMAICQTLSSLLPPHMFKHWRRGNIYLSPDGKTLISENAQRELIKKGDQRDEEDLDNVVDEEPAETLESLINRLKPDDLDDEEAKEVLQLLLWILNLDPEKRPSAEQILQHPWFN